MRSAYILAPYRFTDHERDRRLTRAVYALAICLTPIFGAATAFAQHMA